MSTASCSVWERTLPAQSRSTTLLSSGSAFPGLDFSALGPHSCDIHSEVDIASSNLFYQSHVVTCGDTSHGIYFAFLVSTVFPGFCCSFS